MANVKIVDDNVFTSTAPWATAELDDGRVAQIVPLTFGRARLCVGPRDELYYDDVW